MNPDKMVAVSRRSNGKIYHRARGASRMQSSRDWAAMLKERKILKDLVERDYSEGISKDDLPSYWSDDIKTEWIARWEIFKTEGEIQFFIEKYEKLLERYKNTPFLMSKNLNLDNYI